MFHPIWGNFTLLFALIFNLFTFPFIQPKPLRLPSSLHSNKICIPTQIPKIGFFLIKTFSDKEFKNPDFLSKLISGKLVFISSPYKDRYSRYLSDVYIYDDEIAIYINAKLIKSGNAWVYKSYRSNEYLMNLENFARNNSKGLWSNKKPTEPWIFRKIEKK